MSPGLEATIEADRSPTWTDLAEAIALFKQMTAVRIGEDMAAVEFSPQYYNEDNWALVENEGNRLLATYQVGPEQYEYREFLKDDDFVELIYYHWQKPYPEQILMRWKIRRADLATTEVARDIPFEPFTAEYAIKYLNDMFFWGEEVTTDQATNRTDDNGQSYFLIGGVPASDQTRRLTDTSGWWYVFDNGSIQEAGQ